MWITKTSKIPPRSISDGNGYNVPVPPVTLMERNYFTWRN